MNKKSFISFLAFAGILFILNVLPCYAQSKQSYVVTQSNDTIKCDIKLSLLGSLTYKPAGENEPVKITPDNVKEFYFSQLKATHVALKISNREAEFIERIVHGKISLYKGNNSSAVMYTGNGIGGSLPQTMLYAQKNNTIYLIKSTGTINVGLPGRQERLSDLKNLLADNAPALTQFNKMNNFNTKAIKKIVEQYNLSMTEKILQADSLSTN